MKLTVGNVLLLCALGCIIIWVAAGFIGYYTFVAAWDYFHKL
ncbi:hypothetical protein RZO95_17295 [Klebsiella variicola subsp. variicola]|nr:hypothetical protein [Klebsiella variicola]MDV0623707.1 hypothetical protein [Klebsiella variicola subsp. variicola]